MEEARNGGGKWSELLKTVLQSQVGGWMMACIAFSAMAWWIIKDREVVYHDLARLRAETLPVILETRKVVDDARDISADNNRILSEIRSYMNIPLENRSDIKKVLKEIQRIPKEGEVDNINQ